MSGCSLITFWIVLLYVSFRSTMCPSANQCASWRSTYITTHPSYLNFLLSICVILPSPMGECAWKSWNSPRLPKHRHPLSVHVVTSNVSACVGPDDANDQIVPLQCVEWLRLSFDHWSHAQLCTCHAIACSATLQRTNCSSLQVWSALR